MKYFKNEIGTVYAYEDDVDEKYVKSGLTEISEEEALSLANPAPTYEQLVADADAQKKALIEVAQRSISLLQTKLLMGRALTDAETNKVNKTLDYIDAVTATDTRTAPDIEWPLPPQ